MNDVNFQGCTQKIDSNVQKPQGVSIKNDPPGKLNISTLTVALFESMIFSSCFPAYPIHRSL